MMIPFRKYHGCGNDFILMKYTDVYPDIISDLIVKICDRHTGIGADGLILVKTDPLEMIYFNQDGSRAPMCGNGIRCFSKFCIDEGILHKSRFIVKTQAGDKLITALAGSNFEVKMGQPIDDLSLCGIENPIWGFEYEFGEKKLKLYTLFQSTIHTVVYLDSLDYEFMEQAGKTICESPLFKEQTNVNFVHIKDTTCIEMQTYERGCGMTLACGTGACASAVVSKRLGLCGSKVDVILPKGTLEIRIDDNEQVKMIGPAKCIAKGEYNYETD